jgi:hypothetical protein
MVAMTTLTSESILDNFLLPEERADLERGMNAELRRLTDSFQEGGFRRVAEWPFPLSPIGVVRDEHGDLASGAYARHIDPDELELVVCANGWPIEHSRCPGPVPPPLPLTDPLNLWLSSQPAVMGDGDFAIACTSTEVGLGRVLHKAKPLALGDVDNAERAEQLRSVAEAAGLVVDVRRETFDWLDHHGTWFLTTARPETFDELVDLDAICAWYERALSLANASHLVKRFVTSVAALAGQSPADFVTRGDDLVMAPFSDFEPGMPTTSVIGVVLGYWPPTTAALYLTHLEGSDRYERFDFPSWTTVRLHVSDVLSDPDD